MEKKSKAEKLKLRGINQTILISSYNSGAGTGPNDCMTEEVYQRLNAQGALDTTVRPYHPLTMTGEGVFPSRKATPAVKRSSMDIINAY